MLAKVLHIAKDHVAERAALDTNVFLLHQLLEMREELDLETVADALRAEHNSVLEVLDVARLSLTGMEESGHLLARLVDDGHFVLVVQNCLRKSTDLWREVFLVDEVEAGDKLSDVLVLTL